MSPKILTVDDSRVVQGAVRRALRPFGCQLFSAANGREGLALAARLRPALILLDIAMPVMGGVEMLQRLKAHRGLKKVPILMLTRESGLEHGRNIMKLGVQGYLIKPFPGEAVAAQVRQLCTLPASGTFRRGRRDTPRPGGRAGT